MCRVFAFDPAVWTTFRLLTSRIKRMSIVRKCKLIALPSSGIPAHVVLRGEQIGCAILQACTLSSHCHLDWRCSLPFWLVGGARPVCTCAVVVLLTSQAPMTMFRPVLVNALGHGTRESNCKSVPKAVCSVLHRGCGTDACDSLATEYQCTCVLFDAWWPICCECYVRSDRQL